MKKKILLFGKKEFTSAELAKVFSPVKIPKTIKTGRSELIKQYKQHLKTVNVPYTGLTNSPIITFTPQTPIVDTTSPKVSGFMKFYRSHMWDTTIIRPAFPRYLNSHGFIQMDTVLPKELIATNTLATQSIGYLQITVYDPGNYFIVINFTGNVGMRLIGPWGTQDATNANTVSQFWSVPTNFFRLFALGATLNCSFLCFNKTGTSNQIGTFSSIDIYKSI